MANRYLLWGRSLGAASALLYAGCYPNSDLCGLILDSPFCSFGRLAKDLVTEGQASFQHSYTCTSVFDLAQLREDF